MAGSSEKIAARLWTAATLWDMGRAVGFIAGLMVVAIGGYLYTRQAQTLMPGGTAPKSTIDVVAVRNDLIAIAKAERYYWVSNAKYASLDDLRRNGEIHIANRDNYTYSAETSDVSFKIIAVYSGPDPKAPKRISIDETIALKTD